jgi:type IV pilus assembly protein PilB
MAEESREKKSRGLDLSGVFRTMVPGRLRKWGTGSEGGLPLYLRLLVEKHGLSLEAIESWLQSGRISPAEMGAHLLPLVGREALLEVLEEQFEIESFDLEAANLSPSVAQVIPPDVGGPYGVICLNIDEFGLTLGMVDPSDESAVNQVEGKTDFKVHRRMVVLAPDLVTYQQMLYDTPRVLKVNPRDLVDDIIRQAIEQKASDIHIEPMEDEVRVRFRKDGVLVRTYDLSAAAPKKVILRHLKTALPVVVKNKSGASGKTMKIDENQKPQDGRISLPGRNVDMRVSILPSVHGESIVIRIHSPEQEAEDFHSLGFSNHNLDRFIPIIESPYGMLLVSGPTGSGKTTTLYTVLRRLNEPGCKILTVEDPVEYTIPGIIQVQTNPAKAVTFAEALRSFLRHDPDIIMVGEIRDRETAMMAVEASLTGHLVLSTIHANDAVRTLTRIRDLGISPLLINSTCLGTLAQRLVRTNCPVCSEPVNFSERFYSLLEQYHVPYQEGSFLQGRGCDRCNRTGYQGRLGIYELLVMSPELRSMLLEQAADSEIEDLARQQGMKLLLEDALAKAAEGRTTEAEILRVTMAGTGATRQETVPTRTSRRKRTKGSVPGQPVATVLAESRPNEAPTPPRPILRRRFPEGRLPAMVRDEVETAWSSLTPAGSPRS